MSAAGGAIGCLFAYVGVDALAALLPAGWPRSHEIVVDTRVLAFAAASSLSTGLLFGLAPAWELRRNALAITLQRGTLMATQGLSGRRLLGTLVVSEMALAMIVLCGAGLLMNSFWRLNQSDPGFNPQNVLTFSVTLASEKYPRPAETFRELQRRFLEIPGVQAASTGMQLPDRGLSMIDDVSPFIVTIEGAPILPHERRRTSLLSTQPGYFRAMGIPLVRGRDFIEQDMAGQRRIAIINESLARTYFPDEDPIGKHLALDSWTLAGEDPAEFVGVARDLKHRGLLPAAQPFVYLPLTQRPRWVSHMVVRTDGDPLRYVGPLKATVGSFDKDQPIDDVQALSQRVAKSLAQDRFLAFLLAIFSTIAVVLAAIGLYGVLSHVIAERTQEVGIRMALGAKMWQVRALILYRGMRWAAVGIVSGLAGALVLTRLIASLLFGITAIDPVTFVVITLLMVVVAAAACWVPADHATKLQPSLALRCE
jgi:putative ABC transport system permease protein